MLDNIVRAWTAFVGAPILKKPIIQDNTIQACNTVVGAPSTKETYSVR